MSGKINHDYHLVDLSPLPLLISLSLIGTTVGGVMHMHDKVFGQILMMISMLGVIVCAYRWWKDVVKEARVDKAHTKVVQQGLRLGMALFILSELMFFAAIFGAFFNASITPVAILEDIWPIAAGIWPPEGIVTFDPWHLPLLNTLVLLLSGCTVTWAHHALLHDDHDGLIQGLACTVALGVSFTILQAIEYSHAPFAFSDGVYAANFYLSTGFHGLHVIIGTIFLAVCLIRAYKKQFTKQAHLGFEFAAWYWHFVDVVWIFLYIFVYIWGR